MHRDRLSLRELVATHEREAAQTLLWPTLRAAERAREFERASAGNVASLLLGALRHGQVVGAVRVHLLAGRMAMLAPPRLLAGEPRETAVELLHAAQDRCRQAACRVIHALVSSPDGPDAELLNLGGWREVAKLLLLMSLSSCAPQRPPALACELNDVGQAGIERLAAVMQRTYKGSLDCPETEGMRSVDDILTGYRSAGGFAPERWLVATHAGRDLGCLVLTDVSDESQWELTYLGVVPEVRGQGLGVQLVRHAQWMTRAAGRARLVVAVDAKNFPALAVYAACEFIEWSRQCVYVCALG